MSVYRFDSTGVCSITTSHSKCGIAFRETEDSPKYCVTFGESDIHSFNVTKESDDNYMFHVMTHDGPIMFRSVEYSVAIKIYCALISVFQPHTEFDVKLYVK